ncbi:hypothetical protein CEUSTIGMA_g12899.t1 [Chlamydomonas eustigma]|uniref:Uncharacterized protein n=1 Tax=Chlamydomonas eustigma TaxID=1157962 RepID=A0A250XR30_9CHLO|nr:hypothetical protein CEUSTIGMA_g12899.t1 [Chlamydomonas eustigma]|eukprot:GAX85483.1 hypothetical protein CEUSTIGMA_g12899.t1 [Chlamydomonas eustigma]
MHGCARHVYEVLFSLAQPYQGSPAHKKRSHGGLTSIETANSDLGLVALKSEEVVEAGLPPQLAANDGGQDLEQKEERKRDVHATMKSVQKFVGLLDIDKTVGKRWKQCIVEKRPLQGNSYAYCLSHDVPLEFDEEDVSRVRKKLVYILATGQRF